MGRQAKLFSVCLYISGVHGRRGWRQALRVLCEATRQCRSKAVNVFRFFDPVVIIQRTYVVSIHLQKSKTTKSRDGCLLWQ